MRKTSQLYQQCAVGVEFAMSGQCHKTNGMHCLSVLCCCFNMVQLSALALLVGNDWCFVPTGAASSGSTGPWSTEEVPWDATSHIDPILSMLHAWCLKAGAPMPSISRPAALSVPVAKRIDHKWKGENQDRQESKFISQPHNQGSRTQ